MNRVRDQGLDPEECQSFEEQRVRCCWETECHEKRHECVDMKDAGNTDWCWDGGNSYWSGWKRTEVKKQNLCVGLQGWAEKQGQEEAVLFACFPFLRGKVLRMFACGGKWSSNGKKLLSEWEGKDEKFLSGICDSGHWDLSYEAGP